MAFFYKYEYTNKRKNIHPCLTVLWSTIRPQISKLREQAEEQESSLKAQEEEVNCKKRELEVAFPLKSSLLR